MCLFFSFLPATVWLVLGFFVLFAASKAVGTLGTFGRVLGVWALVIAVLFPIMGAYMTLSGACPMGAMMERVHSEASP